LEGLKLPKEPKLPKVEGLKAPKIPKPLVVRAEGTAFKEPNFAKEVGKLPRVEGVKLSKEFKVPKVEGLKAPKIPKGF
jgi:hypothetical protein